MLIEYSLTRTLCLQNVLFAETLEQRVLESYRKSWIAQYFKWNVTSNHGIVYFVDSNNKPVTNNRFKVYIHIPEITKPYFLPLSDVEEYKKINLNNFETSIISNIKHGFKTKSLIASKSLFYVPPYFIKLTAPNINYDNYLGYQNFYKSNIKNTILAMVITDEFDNLQTIYAPELLIPYSASLNLDAFLQFIIVDSNGTLLQVEDGSQLFFSATLYDTKNGNVTKNNFLYKLLFFLLCLF